jgi:hypothetical protein
LVDAVDLVTPPGSPPWPLDPVDHGTTCAELVAEAAPRAEILCVRVLNGRLRGRAPTVLAGLQWALERRADLCNLSLYAADLRYRSDFAALVEEAERRACVVVAAADPAARTVLAGMPGVVLVAVHPDPEARIGSDATGAVDLVAPDPRGCRPPSPSFATASVTGRIAALWTAQGPLTARRAAALLSASPALSFSLPGA